MIAVLTTGTRPRLLGATLAAIDSSARSPNKVVVVDHYQNDLVPAVNVPPGWAVGYSERPTQRPYNKYGLWACLSYAFAVGESLLYVEDDVAMCRGAARYMESYRTPAGIDFVSFYAPWGDAQTPAALWVAPASVFVFAQTLLFPVSSVVTLVSKRAEIEGFAQGGADEVLQKVCKSYGTHYPGTVQHVGDESVVGNGGLHNGAGRYSRAYAGDLFDCSRLVVPLPGDSPKFADDCVIIDTRP